MFSVLHISMHGNKSKDYRMLVSSIRVQSLEKLFLNRY